MAETEEAKSKVEILLTDEFKEAFRIINDTNDNAFLTGKAGSGKSTFLRYLVEKSNKSIVLLASTGIAAVNISSKKLKAQTIHSFFTLPPAPLSYTNLPKVTPEKRDLWTKMDLLIIEEVSMVRVDVMWAIDVLLKESRNSSQPFGGTQVLMVGDLCQLPPVMAGDTDKELISHRWNSEFFFDAEVFKQFPPIIINFTRIFRQTDDEFTNILNDIRMGEPKQESLDKLNTRLTDRIQTTDCVTLCTTNKDADYINQQEISKLPGQDILLKATVTGTFNKNSVPINEMINVKIGCRVMIRVNIKEFNIFNGMTGILTEITENPDGEEVLKIKTKDMMIALPRKVFESIKYTYSKETKGIKAETIGTFTQFPISIAYSVSIHKSQGMTLEKMNLNIGRGGFASGQTYVAISRCKTLEGIFLTKRIQKSDVFLDSRVKKFLESQNR